MQDHSNKKPNSASENGTDPQQQQNNPSADSDQSGGIQMPEMPAIDLPKGGGAIAGIGEKFQANPATGTGSFTIPLAMSPARDKATPELKLTYNSGSGNSPFGLGWSLGIPAITRKNDKAIPTYQDSIESDTFIMSGVEDLVPMLDDGSGSWIRVERDETTHRVYAYRPRTEGLFAKIERWENKSTGISHWETTSSQNTKTIYGASASSRVADPADPRRVYSWLIEQTIDPRQNVIEYGYKAENSAGVSQAVASEKNRIKHTTFPQKYLKTVKYGNTVMYDHASFGTTNDWHFQLVLDYGEHDQVDAPTTAEVNTWEVRQDPFSKYRSGFEIRTWRLCKRILLFHKFSGEATLGSSSSFVLVKSTELTHDADPVATKVTRVTQRSYNPDGSSEAVPPIDLTYSKATMDSTLRHFDAEDLENLPMGVDGQQYVWSDLNGEGITGIVTETNGAWYYKPNYGDESYYYDYAVANPPEPEIRFGAQQTVATKPVPGVLQQLVDVSGDGQVDLVIKSPELVGYFERQQDGEWQRFHAFDQVPNINWKDPNTRMLDLSGNGLADVLITEDECLRWYANKGKKGYTLGQQSARHMDEEKGPALVFANSMESIYLSNMSGGGLTDICRVRNGEVCYWPNLGYGRFGEKVTMDNAPTFDRPDLFSQNQVKLVDLDGSGTTDIIYLGSEKVSYWSNNSGNSFSLEKEILNFPKTDNTTSVQAIDLFGKGTSCLVWSSPLPGDFPYRIKYIDLMGQKPYLLTEINNNIGARNKIHYAPSTKFYLRDRQEGNPWVTKLPFPVQVVERTESFDEVTQMRFVQRYAYHHGFYDREEREFRGFGMVEQWDSEQYDSFATAGLFQVGSNALDEASHIPPIHTKTWFHTGHYEESGTISSQYHNEYYTGDTNAWELEDMRLPTGLTATEERQAARALKGQPLRSEIYADDNTAFAHLPYTVTENRYEIKAVQPKHDEKYAVFQVIPAESLIFQNERTAADSRISQTLVLATNAYGQVTKNVSIAYQRRGGTTVPETAKTFVIYTEKDYINQPTGSNGYFIGSPRETRTYDITGVNTASANLDVAAVNAILSSATSINYEVEATTGYQKRLISKTQAIYTDAACTGSLPAGEIAPHGLLYQSKSLVFTDAIVAAAFNNDGTTRVTSTILQDEGGYLQDGTDWYSSSPIPTFDPANFYKMTAQTDQFGNATTITFDTYNLAPIKTTDTYGNVSLSSMDYRILAPYLVTDINGNRQQVKFDTLGMVIAHAVMGKTTESLGDTIAAPTVEMTYNLFNWMTNGKPNYVQSRSREEHGGSNWIENYTYSSGSGSVILQKSQVEDGQAFQRDSNNDLVLVSGEPVLVNCTNRWVGSGRTVLNNKGDAVKQYESYFSCTHEYEAETEVREYGVTAIISYDPLGRPIRTDMPNGTFTKVEFSPWEQRNYDLNDTVKDSDWYVANGSPLATDPEPTNPDTRAAWLALKHYNTPQVSYFDPLGRGFEKIDDNNVSGATLPADFYTLSSTIDVEGKLRLSTNDKAQTTRFTYSMRPLQKGNGDIINTTSPDGGWRRSLSDVTGKPIRSWDERGLAFRMKYDNLQRNTHTYVTESGTEKLISFILYGDNAGLADPTVNNLAGHPIRSFDQAGLNSIIAVDFKRNAIEVRKQIATNYKTTVDWIALDALTSDTAVLAAASSMLDADVFTTISSYDALNRAVLIQMPDNSQVKPVFNKANLLEQMKVKMAHASSFSSYVTNIDYDAKGQRTSMSFGNGSKTTYTYEADTFKLSSLLTTRNGGADKLQELLYTYDPVGNIVEIEDRAQQSHYFSNHLVLPKALYEYDSMYRLKKAQGREKLALSMPVSSGYTNELLDLSTAVSATGFATYIENYTYDSLGNLKRLQHELADSSLSAYEWTRNYQYTTSTTNNYLLSTYTGAAPPSSAEYTYDAHGNMTSMPHLSTIEWDVSDQMKKSVSGTETTYYVYSAGKRVRKVTENSSTKRTSERIYIGDYELYRMYKADGVTVKLERKTVHLSDDGRRIAMMEVKTNDNGPILLASQTSTTRYQYTNHLDSAALELDDNADIISYEEYHPFGTTSFSMHSNHAEVSTKIYRFVNKERDEETGLDYFGARYYAAWLCRFASVDPLKDQYPFQSSYVYAANNPITYVDVNGEGPGDPEETEETKQEEKSEKGWYENEETDTVHWLEKKPTEGEWNYFGETLDSFEASGALSAAGILEAQLAIVEGDEPAHKEFSKPCMGCPAVMIPVPAGPFSSTEEITKLGTELGDGRLQLNDDFKPENFYHLVVSSFGHGIGFETYVFGEDSKVSEDLFNTSMTAEAITIWLNDNDLSSEPIGIGRSPKNPEHLKREFYDEPSEKGYIKTITHTMGSATYTFTESESGDVKITVTNTTSVPSATGANAKVTIPFTDYNVLGRNQKISRPDSDKAQPWTNVSQEIVMVKTVAELIDLMNSYNED